MTRYRVLSHTADLRLRVYGKELDELFQNAAFGLSSVLLEDSERLIKRVRGFEKIEVEGSDASELLVNFLNEILTRSNIDKKIYPRAKVLRISPTLVEAHIFGVPVDGFSKDVKAVSYYNAEVKKGDNGFEATLILDV